MESGLFEKITFFPPDPLPLSCKGGASGARCNRKEGSLGEGVYLLCHHRHRPCCRQSPATLVAIALVAKAIALFVALHPRRQHHRLLHPPLSLRHPPLPPLSPSPSPCRPHPFRHMLPLLVIVFFHLQCRLGGEPTGEPTRNDLMVDKAGTGTKTSYYSSRGALVASRRPPFKRLAMVGCCVLC